MEFLKSGCEMEPVPLDCPNSRLMVGGVPRDSVGNYPYWIGFIKASYQWSTRLHGELKNIHRGRKPFSTTT